MSVYTTQNKPSHTIDVMIGTLILMGGLLFFPLKGVALSPDAAWYLNHASRLYHDFCLENLMVHRPLFPLLICVSFHFFGNSIESALVVVRLFFVLNLVLAYVLGLNLYNRSTGIGFSLLLFTSFVINRWSSYLLVDAIIPFFIFFFILLVFLAFEKQSRFFFCLAGSVLGAAFLIKGVLAFLFGGLPVCLLVIKKYRCQFKQVLFLYLAALLVMLPWIGYCIGHNDFSLFVGKMFDPSKIQASGLIPVSDPAFYPWEMIQGQLKDLVQFFLVYIHHTFVLSYLLLLGLVHTLGCCIMGRSFSVKKHRAHVCLLWCLVLFSPIIYIGMQSKGINFRQGQFMILYFLLYLMASALMVELSDKIAQSLFFKTKKQTLVKYAAPVVFTGLLFLCLGLQIFIGTRGNHTFYGLTKAGRIQNTYGFSFWQGEFNDRDGWSVPITREAAQWISTHVPKHKTLLCQWFYLAMMDYLTENQYDFQQIEHSFVHGDPGEKALFVWPRYKTGIMKGNSLVALYEQNFLSQVNTQRAAYIVVTPLRNFLTLYLQNHPDFELIHSITRGRSNVKIFKTKQFPVGARPGFKVKFTQETYDLFHRADQENPGVLEGFKREMKQILNWEDTQVERFVLLAADPDPARFWKAYEKVRTQTVYDQTGYEYP